MSGILNADSASYSVKVSLHEDPEPPDPESPPRFELSASSVPPGLPAEPRTFFCLRSGFKTKTYLRRTLNLVGGDDRKSVFRLDSGLSCVEGEDAGNETA